MTTRYTANDVRNLTTLVQLEARALGLINENTEILYSAGKPSGGISATLDVIETTNGDRKYIGHSVDFLPEFNYKQTAKDQYKVLEATRKALYAIRRHFG